VNPAIAALRSVLHDLAAVVAALSPEDYARPAAGGKGSVGAHVRHCLDHVAALERGLSSGLIDYDQRVRQTAVETDKSAGLAAIDAAVSGLAQARPTPVDAAIVVSVQIARGLPPVAVASTLGREVAFVISHTVHHSATVAAMLQGHGRRTPPQFGMAASTPLAPEATPCALSA
jgi:uncharacterized damage-inducible protein DinB